MSDRRVLSEAERSQLAELMQAAGGARLDTHSEEKWEHWRSLLADASDGVLLAAIAKFRDGYPANREAISAELSLRMTDRTLATMERLDATGRRLAKIGIAATVAAAIASIVGTFAVVLG